MSSSSAENGSASSGGDSGSCESSQPGSTCASTGSSADALEVRRGPLERRGAVAPQVDFGRRFLIRSICFHVRVFTTSAFVSHARRA